MASSMHAPALGALTSSFRAGEDGGPLRGGFFSSERGAAPLYYDHSGEGGHYTLSSGNDWDDQFDDAFDTTRW